MTSVSLATIFQLVGFSTGKIQHSAIRIMHVLNCSDATLSKLDLMLALLQQGGVHLPLQ
jgi:hypothetical protein